MREREKIYLKSPCMGDSTGERDRNELLHRIRIGELPNILGSTINQFQITGKGLHRLGKMLQKEWDDGKGIAGMEPKPLISFSGRLRTLQVSYHYSPWLYDNRSKVMTFLFEERDLRGKNFVLKERVRFRERTISENPQANANMRATIKKFVEDQLSTKVNYENYHRLSRIYSEGW